MSFRSAAVLLAVSLGVSVDSANAQESPGKRYAIVVGVNSYNNRSLHDLQFAERDATVLADELKLTKNGYEVRLLLGSSGGADQATRKNIQDAIESVLNRVSGRKDLILAAFAGHGVQAPVKGADGRERETPFFCPFDARGDAADPGGGKLDPATLVDLNEVIRRLNVNGGKHNLLLVDACRDNPSQARGRGVDGSVVENLATGTAVLFSCSQGLRAFETLKAGGGHGIFFHLVIEGLRGKAADGNGMVSWSRLSDYVQANVDDRVRDWVGADFSQGPHEVKNLVGRPPLLTGLDATPSASPVNRGSPHTVVPPMESREGLQKIISNTTGMQLMEIPAGKSLYGEGKTPQEITIEEPFYLGKYEVTQGEWATVMGTTPWKGQGFVKEGAQFPATNLSWEAAKDFCRKLSEIDGRTYRLPSEKEWEYACRAGSRTKYSFGDSEDELEQNEWYCKNADKVGERYAHEVGKKKKNALGLHDMHGNVMEWCEDSSDPKGIQRIVRGGSWYVDAANCRSALRSALASSTQSVGVGFRIAASSANATGRILSKKQSFPLKAAPQKQTPVAAQKIISSGTAMELLLIPAGAGWYGEGKTQREITIEKPFYLGKCEVTQGEWQAVMGTTPWKGKANVIEGSRIAASYVTWDDSKEFCRKLSEQDQRTYRLPSEKEWEYACRAGSRAKFCFGDAESQLSRYAWFGASATKDGEKHPHEVGGKEPNAWGLFDMHGNVWERCEDSYDEAGQYRVGRGGSWFSAPASYCRSEYRGGYASTYATSDMGFRVAANFADTLSIKQPNAMKPAFKN